MPTKIYMVRHGESQANEKDMFIGHTDMALTERGRKQAKFAAEFLKHIRPDAIYSSDLQRAFHTAQATAENWGMDVIPVPELREIYAGEWEKVTFARLREDRKESFGTWVQDLAHARCDGGESVAEVMDRVVRAVEKIAQNHENGTVFLFSHGTPIRAMGIHAMGKTLEEISDLPWASNASVTEMEYDGNGFRLIRYSEDGFMGALSTKLPEDV